MRGGLLVGMEGLEVSCLQFANDTILFLPDDRENLQHVMLLQIFEAVSKLHINLSKSGLVGINVQERFVMS